MKEEPLPFSERTGVKVSTDLEELVMRCLAKQPAERPATAEALEQALAQCANAGSWTRAAGEEWWRTNVLSRAPAQEAALLEKTLVIAPRE